MRNRFKKHLLAGSTAALAAVVASTGFVTAFADSVTPGHYYVDKTFEEYVEQAEALNGKIMQEGMILLKNNGALPLAKNSAVTVLGAGSYKTYWGEASVNAEGKYCYVSESLENAGISVNPAAAEVYSSVSTVKIGNLTALLEPELSKVTAIESTFGNYNDAAIITLSRSCAESFDLLTDSEALAGYGISGEHQLALYDSEKELIKTAKEKFEKVIVLLNAATMVQFPELNEEGGEYEADAVMYIGLPGQYGLRTLGTVLNGEVSPSGRTVDTWYSDFKKDPAFQNSLNNLDKIGETYSVEYEEGIYLGYKYYETAYAEIADGNYEPAGYTLTGATDAEKAENWYNEAVTYPFGYGLSYTTFTQKLSADNDIDLSGLSFDDYININVTVKNTGEYSGKEVVQIYSHAPYTAGGIEKSEVVLAGFAKTDTLAPGEEQEVTVSVRVGDLASYDYNDANGDGWYGYEIENGNYELRLQSNSHDVIDTLSYTVDQTIIFNNDGTLASGTNSADSTVFSNGNDFDTLALVSSENGGTFTVMSRSDFKGTFPTAPSGTNSYAKQLPVKYNSEFTPDMDSADDPWYVSADDDRLKGWTQGANTSYKFIDISGIDYTSEEEITYGVFSGMTGVEAWKAFMNQLTWEEIVAIVNNGNFGSGALTSIDKAAELDKNGPEQLGDGTSWACANIMAATYNVELLEERGVAMGNEALYNGYNGWYGPTGNINRTPFGGRNHIYYSEDSLLTGKVSAALIRGAQSRGVIAYVKHFALNEQETQRHGLATWVTEQALRETYLKAFEYAVKEGGTLGIMQSLNKIGGVNGFGNYALDTQVLREEWGYKGALVTDAYNASLVRENMAQRMGGDMPLGTWKVSGEWNAASNTVTYNGTASPTQWYVIRTSAMHILYMAANSSNTYNGYNIAAFTTQTINYDAGETKLYLNVGEEFTLDLGVDTSVIGTENIVYKATGLPAGLTLDPNTGVISGTPTAESEKLTGDIVTVTLQVTSEGEEWIAGSVSVRMLVQEAEDDAPKGSGCSASGCGSISTSMGTIISSFIAVGGMLVISGVVRRKKAKECK